MLQFDNRFLRTFPGDASAAPHSRQVHGAIWSHVKPTPVSAPQLIAYSIEVAQMLGISESALQSSAVVSALAGNATLPGMETYATVYGGHQFGNWAGQLGDGRAILLGETVSPSGARFELQLKGAGPTPYSRRADGRAVLRSSIREFLCSEAMHHLGVPTTRALSLVLTGDRVERDMFYDGNPELEPGAIVCRVAPSFLRFGHYEIFASRGESALLRTLVDYTIATYYPAINNAYIAPGERICAWYGEVCERTAELMADWMRVGFVHGVMNTDNMSILGLTIDYGPYGWIDNFDPGWTPNTTDAQGRRYAFGRQPGIAQWNLARLGDALATLEDVSTDALAASLARYEHAYGAAITRAYSAKLGVSHWVDDEGDLLDELFALFGEAEIDMTLFFRALCRATNAEALSETFYSPEAWRSLSARVQRWFARLDAQVLRENPSAEARAARVAAMLRANPKYVLRNYLAQQAIDAAHAGDFTQIDRLLEVMRRPYDEQPEHESIAAKRPEWARVKAGCSMLSCSS